MTGPTIHSNGTSADDLLFVYREALQKTRVLRAALTVTAPNMRDYYVNGDEGWFDYGDAHHAQQDRLAAVAKIERELESLIIHVLDQKEERA